MKSKFQMGLTSLLGVFFLFGGMAFAKTKQIDVIFPAMVGNSLKLKAGTYRINVAQDMQNPEVKFYNQEGTLVGEAPAKVLDRAQKNSRTSIDYDKLASSQEALTRISPEGWRETLVFSHAGVSSKE
jgi:hypothetical protein